MKFPYPDFTWSITQHIKPATDSRTMYELLQAAYIHADDSNYQTKITDYMVMQGYLTENFREDAGRPQLWRDYQQVLPELGLIVSTRFTEGVIITPIGLMWLDGLIGHSELVTTQCLKIQYPNGHKQDISFAQKKTLQSHNLSVPSSRVELDSLSGVLIKPAVLLLRILLELYSINEDSAYLTIDECFSALLPIKTNSDWPLALGQLQKVRSSDNIVRGDSRRRRHIQEWFRLLNLSDLFDLVSVNRVTFLRLSQTAIKYISDVQLLCHYHEDPETFWYPTPLNKTQLALSWFEHIGTPIIESEWLRPFHDKDTSYIQENYPYGQSDDGLSVSLEKNFSLNPKPYFVDQSSSAPSEINKSDSVNIDKILQGRQKQRERTRLHEKIVFAIAKKLSTLSYDVFEDRRSVDLLATKNDHHILLEVKTINANNLTRMMRLGIGQLSEYRYRHTLQSGFRPISILAVSSRRRFPDWLIEYYETDIDIGLISVTSDNQIKAHTSGQIENLLSNI